MSRAAATKPWGLYLAGLLALTFVVYWPSLQNGFVSWDDDFYVAMNPVLARPSLAALITTPIAANWHPLTIASLLLDYRISGTSPATYHWINLLLHVANTALVFVFVRALSRNRFWTTVVTALFFGIHPMHVESVAWIAERKDVLYGFFYLLALIFYVRRVDGGGVGWIWAAFVSMALSVLAKPAAVVLPLSLLAIDWFRRRRFDARLWAEKVPFFALGIAGGLVNLYVQKSLGALTVPHPWSLVDKVFFASYALVAYVAKLFVPVHLSAVYPYPAMGAALPPRYVAAFLAVLVLLPLAIVVLRRNRPALFGIAFFFVNIVLVLQLITVGTAVLAERYTYLPYVGLFFALAWPLDDRGGSGFARGLRRALATLFVLLGVFSVAQTWSRCSVWHDPETFWTDAIRKQPGEIVPAYVNRGTYYRRTGRLELARRDYTEALALNPQIPSVWYYQGTVFAALGLSDSAMVCFDRALEGDPRRRSALNDRGALRLRRGDAEGAVRDFSRLIELDSLAWSAYSNRALAWSKLGENEKAVADGRKAVAVDP
ncbi:MAG TPA: tetratricopeptide repeat protein, partial [Candidatus Eisenbacteria bacterium]|nr:tetratricopeptide repeat protein [Candidatus Eisenbacteria bacterium]